MFPLTPDASQEHEGISEDEDDVADVQFENFCTENADNTEPLDTAGASNTRRAFEFWQGESQDMEGETEQDSRDEVKENLKKESRDTSETKSVVAETVEKRNDATATRTKPLKSGDLNRSFEAEASTKVTFNKTEVCLLLVTWVKMITRCLWGSFVAESWLTCIVAQK